jgi:Fibronectin type III domain
MVIGGIVNALPADAETGHSAIAAAAADLPVLYFQHSFYPESGVVGTPVTISGLNLTSTIGVRFNNTPASFTVTPGQPGSPDSSILTTVPAGARSGPITVTNPAGATTTQNSFTVNPPPPTFTRYAPTSGPVGTAVTISGAGFTAVTGVSFNEVPATEFTVTSDGSITATVPPDATTGPITVSTTTSASTTRSSFVLQPRTGTPSAPGCLSVTTTGVQKSSATLHWVAPTSSGSSPIVKYRVSRDGTSSTGFGAFATEVPAGTLSLTFSQLLPGVTYRFTVRAVNAVGSGVPASVAYKTKRSSSIFAINTVTKKAVQVDPNGGGPHTVGKGFIQPTQVLKVPAGKVVVLDRGAKKIFRVDPASGQQTILGRGLLTDPQQISVDGQGNIFALDQFSPTSSQIVRIDAVTNKVTVAVPSYAALEAVDWIASSIGKVFVVRNPTLITRYSGFPGSPVATVTRSSFFAFTTILTKDAAGGVYFRNQSTGGSGASSVSKVPAGSNQEQDVPSVGFSTGKGLVSTDAAGNLFSAYPRFVCFGFGSHFDGCVDDPGVDVINKLPVSGAAVVPIPVTGFTLADPNGPSSPSAQAIGLDAQDVIVVQRVDGIVAYAPNGGAPDVLASGAFSSLAVG